MIEKQICEVCNEKPSNPDKSKNMIICDDCHDYFECMTEANDSLGEAWSEFEKAHPDGICMECMNCCEWVALKSVNDAATCPRCGGALDQDLDVESCQGEPV